MYLFLGKSELPMNIFVLEQAAKSVFGCAHLTVVCGGDTLFKDRGLCKLCEILSY